MRKVRNESAEFCVFEEAVDIWRMMEERWRAIARQSIEERGVLTVALSGGRTPVGFYCHLSRRENLPWEKTEIFQVDERFVPPESEDSNARMIRSSLLDGGSVPPGRMHFVPTGEPSAAAAAARYAHEIRSVLPRSGGELPHFDLILLGIGEDGHTASLFPGAPELQERERWVVAARPVSAPHERITLALPVINHARHVFFLATGSAKADVIRRVRAGEGESLPVSLVQPENGKLFFFLDQQAGGGI
jgi:6-phosphogluconolactonase